MHRAESSLPLASEHCTSRNYSLRQSSQMRGQPTVQTFTELPCQQDICLTGNQWCGLLTFAPWQGAKASCRWLLTSPLTSFMSIVDLSAASPGKAGVGRTRTGPQIFVLFQWKQMFSLRSHMHMHSHRNTTAARCRGGFTLSFVVCHLLSAENREGRIFSLESLQIF